MTDWLVALMLLGSPLATPLAVQGAKMPEVAQSDPESRWSGLAGWCGGGERLNRYGAMGRGFNPRAREAAMWDVPFGTMVKVTSLDNGRSVVVRITDRGPARRLRKTRVIDLTRRAFAQIAPLRQGVVPVVVQRIR